MTNRKAAGNFSCANRLQLVTVGNGGSAGGSDLQHITTSCQERKTTQCWGPQTNGLVPAEVGLNVAVQQRPAAA